MSEKIRQSYIAQFQRCPLSAKLSEQYPALSHATIRGTIFHSVAELITREAIKAGNERVSGDVAREIAQHVMAEHPPLPPAEQEVVRTAAWNFGEAIRFDHSMPYLAIETAVELPLNGLVVRGTMDRAQLELPDEVHIYDYKTSLHVPGQEDFERSFQPQFYSLLACEGVIAHPDDYSEQPGIDPDTYGLPFCHDGLSIARVHVHWIYPRYRDADGLLVERTHTYERAQLADFKRGLLNTLEQLARAQASGEYPAVDGSHCSICPAPHECPIPREARQVETFASHEEASQVASEVDRLEAALRKSKASLRAWAEANEQPIFFGRDLSYDFTLVESEVIRDKDQLKAMLAAEPGLSTSEIFQKRKSTRFGKKKVEARD